MRICFVTPFSWSQPHDVNEHVAGAAPHALDSGGHVVVAGERDAAREVGRRMERPKVVRLSELAGRMALQLREQPSALRCARVA